eukprot:gene4811-3453_t
MTRLLVRLPGEVLRRRRMINYSSLSLSLRCINSSSASVSAKENNNNRKNDNNHKNNNNNNSSEGALSSIQYSTSVYSLHVLLLCVFFLLDFSVYFWFCSRFLGLILPTPWIHCNMSSSFDEQGSGSISVYARAVASSSWDSKVKGDEGNYAAITASLLAQALRGTAISRLALRQRLMGGHCHLLLGAPPKEFEEHIVELANRDTLVSVSNGDLDVGRYDDQAPVGLPDFVDDIRHVVALIRRLKPMEPLSFDSYTRLMQMLDLHGQRVTTLDLGGVLLSGSQPESSPEASLKKMTEIRERYPLPTPVQKSLDVDSDEEQEEDPEDLRHNAELRARIERLQLPYSDYNTALSTLAGYEMDIFLLLCKYLETDTSMKVVLLDNNLIGSESKKAEGTVELVHIRALARMIDANETIKVLDLSHNKLGPNGVGIISKALTKNISMVMVDLSDNQLNADALEETEDPEYEEEDPVFGEFYSGLEAISEVLKKNKFLRVLRLAHNGIHGGEDLNGEAPEEDFKEFDPEQDATDTDVRESWDGAPLWKLVSPFMKFHKLQALDLTGNQLGITGARMIASALSENHSLRVLNLTDNHIGFHGLHYLSKLVISSPHSKIHTYILRRNNLGGKATSRSQQKAALKAMEAFANAVNGNQVIRRLILNDNHLGSQLSAAMLRTISQVQRLEELDFTNNDACGNHHSNFAPDVATYIAAALYPIRAQHRPVLRRLRLSGNNLGSKGLEILFPERFSPLYMLEELDVSRNDIGDALAPLTNVLSVSSITSLNLAYNSIYSLRALYPGIRNSRSLRELNISHNFLGCQESVGCVAETQVGGVAELFSTLAASPTLVNINLSWNDFRQVHGSIFTSVFSDRSSAVGLRKLDISNNPKITAEEVAVMVRQISSRPGMEVFDTSISIKEYNPHPMLEVMNEVVSASDSLVDINLGLRLSCKLGEDEKEDSEAGRYISAMRLRLLLNALIAAKKRESSARKPIESPSLGDEGNSRSRRRDAWITIRNREKSSFVPYEAASTRWRVQKSIDNVLHGLSGL